MIHNSYNTPARSYEPGQGKAVADRTVNRVRPDGTREEWADVAERVALGNAMLSKNKGEVLSEFHQMNHHLRQASLLMSGRHLQHGDPSQVDRNQEVFTNCSTAAASFISFYLLLNGSGVGRSYDDDMVVVDWRYMPRVICAVDEDYPDRAKGLIPLNTPSVKSAVADFVGDKNDLLIYEVEDSREGWAHAVEYVEGLAFESDNHHRTVILDFTRVRPCGSPIRGMQNRPSSGPGPTMHAINKLASLRDRVELLPWEQAMHADHYLAESVLVGGARRAARMATKTWTDPTVFGFIKIKAKGPNGEWPELWSSNNSVTVDEDFWTRVRKVKAIYDSGDNRSIEQLQDDGVIDELDIHAWAVLEGVAYHSYFDGSGEPGLINQDKLVGKMQGVEVFDSGVFAESSRFSPRDASRGLLSTLMQRWKASEFKQITNPCGEISLSKVGGYCVIADVVPFFAADLDDCEDAFRTAVRALIRTNTMDCLYRKEVDRTNRIGVGITGLHEFAYRFFGYGWKDIVQESVSKDFWMTISRFSRACVDEARKYSAHIGVNMPHTATTMKPAGTTSKLFALSEGAHLPAMREYLRFVQFRADDPLVAQYQKAGYPSKELVSYPGTTVIGFPTTPLICMLGMGDKLVTAPEATPSEQYEYLRLLEKYWIVGVEEDGETPAPEYGNQVSYTLKYDPLQVSYEEFRQTLIDGQSTVRCCSVMPSGDTSAYEYQPETPVTHDEYLAIVANINKAAGLREEIGREHVDCGSGACPVDFEEGELEQGAKYEREGGWLVIVGANCPGCASVKRLLDERGFEYAEVPATSSEGMQFLRQHGVRSVPQVFHNQKFVGGLSEVVDYLTRLKDS